MSLVPKSEKGELVEFVTLTRSLAHRHGRIAASEWEMTAAHSKFTSWGRLGFGHRSRHDFAPIKEPDIETKFDVGYHQGRFL